MSEPSEATATRSADAAEQEIDRFISRRAEQRRKDEAEAAAWAESARQYHAREQQDLLWERLRYSERMIRVHTATHEAIIARHRTEVERCERLLGLGEPRLAKPQPGPVEGAEAS